ncbi:MAG: hypothetical protein F4Y02_08940 [Chloroflexi bacterium]|nr:hypothetical protein [Chloroflexota bacterium]
MDESSRRELFETQTSKQYELIGRFVVSISQCELWLRNGIVFMIPGAGNSDVQQYVSILTGHKTMMASSWIEVFEAMLTEYDLWGEGGQKAILEQVCKDFRKMMSRRNKLLHSAAFIGWARSEDRDFHSTRFMKFKISKQEGFGLESDVPKNTDALEAWVKEVRETEKALITVSLWIPFKLSGEDYRLQFSQSGGRWVCDANISGFE